MWLSALEMPHDELLNERFEYERVRGQYDLHRCDKHSHSKPLSPIITYLSGSSQMENQKRKPGNAPSTYSEGRAEYRSFTAVFRSCIN